MKGKRKTMNAKKILACAAAVFSACIAFAEWAPAGELQVASMKALTPQMSTLASRANFPLLPMIAPQLLSKSSLAEKFGQFRQEDDWGAKFYVQDGELTCVFVWPLDGGKTKWEESFPEYDLDAEGVCKFTDKLNGDGDAMAMVREVYGTDEIVRYGAFSADGQWAFLSENRDLAKRAAAEGAPFAKPLVKGIATFSFEGEEVFDSAAKTIGLFEKQQEKIKAAAKKYGQFGVKDEESDEEAFSVLPSNFLGKDAAPFFYALLKEMRSAKLLIGVSKTGLDLRGKFTPRKGSVLNGYTGALPAGSLSFDGFPASSAIAWKCASVHPEGPLGEAWKKCAVGAIKSLNDHLTKWNEKTGGMSPELSAFSKTVSFIYNGVEAFNASSAKSTQSGFFMSENDEGQKSFVVSFNLADNAKIGWEGAVPSNEDEDTIVMSGIKTDKEGLFAVGGKDEGAPDSDGKEFTEKFVKAIPESQQAANILGAARYSLGTPTPDGAIRFSNFYLFAWLDKNDYRTLLRVPSEDIGAAILMVLGLFGMIH